MRSRFSAFAVRDEAYLLRTWHASTRPVRIEFDPDQHWTALHIVGTTGGSLLHTEGTVEFRADYRVGERRAAMSEHSRFVRDDGHWVYLDAITSS
jgi:SEC-C motif-containing protein